MTMIGFGGVHSFQKLYFRAIFISMRPFKSSSLLKQSLNAASVFLKQLSLIDILIDIKINT